LRSLLLLLPSGLSFEVLSLERQVQGSNLPLPKTLIKSLLNVVMPSVSELRCTCGCCNILWWRCDKGCFFSDFFQLFIAIASAWCLVLQFTCAPCTLRRLL
jgi:hypothetical protein